MGICGVAAGVSGGLGLFGASSKGSTPNKNLSMKFQTSMIETKILITNCFVAQQLATFGDSFDENFPPSCFKDNDLNQYLPYFEHD